MDFSPNQVSLSELAKVALGSSKLTNDHLRVLQTLLLILMRKLDCQDEIVRISGFPAQCLKEILEKSQDSHIQVEFQNVENFHTKYILLNQLESRAREIRFKLENHFEEIRKLNATQNFMPIIWDKYALPTEDLCTLYSDGNKDFCIMARNTTFNKAMRQRMTQPVLERMEKMELQVDTMSEKLKAINVRADDTLERLKLVGSLIAQIEKKRQAIDTQWFAVREAMDEIQEMLTCKLDRIALPALKKYLAHQFAIAEDHLLLFTKKDKQCPPVKVISNKDECLSCSPSKFVQPLPVLDLKLPNDKIYKCDMPSREQTLLQKMDKIRVKSYRVTAIPVTSSLNTYDEANASTLSQTLRNQGHYVHTYTNYTKYRSKSLMDLKPLITVAEGSSKKYSYRREKSFNPSKSFSLISGDTRNSRFMSYMSIHKINSKLTLPGRNLSKSFGSGKPNPKASKNYARQEQADNKRALISPVNFLE